MNRTTLPFAVRIVEPRRLNPGSHTKLLNAVVQELLNPATVPKDRFDDPLARPATRRYDLVTFPEAFASADAVVDLATALSGQGPSGCLHLGLRPDDDESNHLFTTATALELAGRLRELVDETLGDLERFEAWLGRQRADRPFNLGCLLAVDADWKLRVCLHPKLVRSKFEADRLPERHMHEANLLTLVTLAPVNPRFGTVTIQPLICSDALDLETDNGLSPPIPAVTQHAGCIADPPNHVDVVSVATCTPQPEGRSRRGAPYRAWHSEFLDAFRSAAERPDRTRHHFASIVLANYTAITDSLGGGLSGIFLPVPPGFRTSDPAVSISCWGRPEDGSNANNAWSTPDDDALRRWSSRGFVAGLDPFAADAAAEARVLMFDVHRLPREASRWRPSESLVAWDVRIWVADPDGGELRELGAPHA